VPTSSDRVARGARPRRRSTSLGRRHLPVSLRRLQTAIAAHAEDYRTRKDAIESNTASVRQLNADIRAWIETWNDDPRPERRCRLRSPLVVFT
jgi:hypothetical protein